ncbi:MAG: hypothetical protein ACFFG0_10650 [Candidatus Thorarchaeota archaeon]
MSENSKSLKGVIQKARNHILSLNDDWNGEGDRSFKEETFNKVSKFLLSLYQRVNIPVFPHISPSENGEIGIHWKTGAFELLLGIPESPDNIVGFYGDDGNGNNQIEEDCTIDMLEKKILPWISNMLLNAMLRDSELYILSLEDNWDGEGGRRFKKETFLRAVRIVRRILDVTGISFIPEILPFTNGGIDIHWKNEKFELLVNVPEDLEEEVGYYGDDGGNGHKVRGKLSKVMESESPLTEWVMEMVEL